MANVEFSEAQKEKLKKYNLLLKNDIKEIIENGIKLEDNIFAFDIKNNKSIVKNIKKDWTQNEDNIFKRLFNKKMKCNKGNT